MNIVTQAITKHFIKLNKNALSELISHFKDNKTVLSKREFDIKTEQIVNNHFLKNDIKKYDVCFFLRNY